MKGQNNYKEGKYEHHKWCRVFPNRESMAKNVAFWIKGEQ
jgi:hypothetical protein